RKVRAAAGASGASVEFIQGDLKDARFCDRLVEEARVRMGRLDVLVNNAGILHRVGALETTDEQWLETMAVNLNAVFFLSRAAARVMKAQGGGAIVNVASELGVFADKGATAYCASKGAIVQLTRAMALDLARDNIRVNAVCPGEVHTQMLEKAVADRGMTLEEGLRRLGRRVPIRRVSKPREIAATILFLASDDASYVTGTALSADGGTSAAGPGGVVDQD
ncbi:MAG: SDR family NAD(P)-dependent oxidoreductase, partial [Alphaproteobacteria bacterium]